MLLAAVTAVSLTACGGTTDEQQAAGSTDGGKQKIEFWMLPVIDEADTQEMVDAFNAQSETTEVELTMLDWSSGREQIKQAVASGAGPDVFYIGAGLDIAYIDGGLLLPLDEHGYSEEDIGKYTDLIEGNMVDGHLLAAPITYENYLLYYRTDVLEQFGFDAPPTTWEELKSMAKTITEGSNGEIMGFQFKGADDQLNAINYSWQTLLAQNGGQLMDLETMQSRSSSRMGRMICLDSREDSTPARISVTARMTSRGGSMEISRVTTVLWALARRITEPSSSRRAA